MSWDKNRYSYIDKGGDYMGRYAGKITHSYSNNPNRPTVEETFQMARVIYINSILEKLPAEEQIAIVNELKEEGLLV